MPISPFYLSLLFPVTYPEKLSPIFFFPVEYEIKRVIYACIKPLQSVLELIRYTCVMSTI